MNQIIVLLVLPVNNKPLFCQKYDNFRQPFLRSFYKAQRASLERKLTFGTRKERKSAAR